MPQGYWAEAPIQEAYYKDADKIPKDVVDEVAAATKVNIPVNLLDGILKEKTPYWLRFMSSENLELSNRMKRLAAALSVQFKSA